MRIQARYTHGTQEPGQARALTAASDAPDRTASPARHRSPGARVARVAVDDETWSAFRELCGETPASVRLGELVAAEVDRAARGEAAGPDPVTALREIREHAAVLDAYVRASLARQSPDA